MTHPLGYTGGVLLLEQGISASCSGAYSLLDPITNIFYYLVPKLATWISGSKIRRKNDLSELPTAGLADRRRYRAEIERMSEAAGVTRKVIPYFGFSFGSHGGKYSLTNPVIQIPFCHLNRNLDPDDVYANFGDATGRQPSRNTVNRYDDQETRFLILRSLVQIRMNDSMVKTGARIAMVAALVLLKINPLTWPISLTILLLAITVYFAVDRYTQGRLDKEAAKSLIKLNLTNAYEEQLKKLQQSRQETLSSPIDAAKLKEEAVDAAISVVEKQRKQNLLRRNSGRRFAKVLINEDGDERLNFTAPSLAKRIQKLESLRAKILSQPTPLIRTRAELEEALDLLESGGRKLPENMTKAKVEEAIGMGRHPLF